MTELLKYPKLAEGVIRDFAGGLCKLAHIPFDRLEVIFVFGMPARAQCGRFR